MEKLREHPFDKRNLYGIYPWIFRTVRDIIPWQVNWGNYSDKAHRIFIKFARLITGRPVLKFLTSFPIFVAFWIDCIYLMISVYPYMMDSPAAADDNSPSSSPSPSPSPSPSANNKPMNSLLAHFLFYVSCSFLVETFFWGLGNIIYKCSNWYLHRLAMRLKNRVVGKNFQPWLFSNFLMNLNIVLVWGHNPHVVLWWGAISVSMTATVCLVFGKNDGMGIIEGLTTCFYISTLTIMTTKPFRVLVFIVSLVVLLFLILCTTGLEKDPTHDSGTSSDSDGSGPTNEDEEQKIGRTSRHGRSHHKKGERPIQLVYYKEGHFRLNPKAVSVLNLIKGPIGVVSICGRALGGKSFLLNQLLGVNNGFQVAPSYKPCTKGIWMWSAPVKRTALDGTEYNLLFLDSEGIDVYDQTGTYSTQIFSLVVLLSSLLIYNQMGGVDEFALDRPSLVSEMTKHIRVKASGGKTTASELGQFSPTFVWLLRDFFLEFVEDYKRITPRDYLEIALRPMQGAAKDIAGKNEIRESICALFPYRECFTLVRPSNSELALRRLDKTSLDKLRPEFVAGLEALKKFVFERTRPKLVGATVMTGPILAGITQSFLDALNTGAVPTISSSWQDLKVENSKSSVLEVRGFENLGASCYVNAVMQNLLSVDLLREYLIQREPAGPLTEAVRNIFTETSSVSKPQDWKTPRKLYDYICDSSTNKFTKDQEEDSHEFLIWLLQELGREELKSRTDRTTDSRSLLEQNIFGGLYSTTIYSPQCDHTSTKISSFLDLQLGIPAVDGTGAPVSLETCLADYWKEENMCNGDRWTCGKCLDVAHKSGKGDVVDSDYLRNATKNLHIYSPPSILCLLLKRFSIGTKLRDYVSFTEIINVQPYMNPRVIGNGDYKYRLLGIVVHKGESMTSGHYVSYVRGRKSKSGEKEYTWYFVDNDEVTGVSLSKVLGSEAYLLFYERSLQTKKAPASAAAKKKEESSDDSSDESDSEDESTAKKPTPDAPAKKLAAVKKAPASKDSSSESTRQDSAEWEAPVLDLAKKQLDKIDSEKSAVLLKGRSIEDEMRLLKEQLEASERSKAEYLRRYEDAINDKKSAGDEYMSHITELQNISRSLEKRCSTLLEAQESARQAAADWKRKYEQISSRSSRFWEPQSLMSRSLVLHRSSTPRPRPPPLPPHPSRRT